MAHNVTLRLENNASNVEVEMGTTLMEVLRGANFHQPYPIVVARVNKACNGGVS